MSTGGRQAPHGGHEPPPTGIEPVIYWHRALPPLDAEILDEHVIEATSSRVHGLLVCRDELWDLCYPDLMRNAEGRLKQEIARLGGDYAHVLGEHIDPRHDDASGEGWLHGLFTYVLCRRSGHAPPGINAS